MLHVFGCIYAQHDLRLVAVSVFLCAFASWTCITMLSRARNSGASHRVFWIIAAGIVFGTGVWATHFVAMLAYRNVFPIAYNISGTILSIAAAVVIGTAGLHLAVTTNRSFVSGAILGLAISVMHYMGMNAIQGQFHVAWNVSYVVASIILGLTFGGLAIFASSAKEGGGSDMAAVALLTVAICAMHFTGMSAVTLVPDPGVVSASGVLAPFDLAITVVAVTIMIVALGLAGAQFDGYLAVRRSAESQRLAKYVTELETVRSNLFAALANADAANKAKSAFLASMSHELRTPLNAIIGFSDFMLSEPKGPLGHPCYSEYATDISRSGRHLLSLVNDILDLSRIDAGKVELDLEAVSLGHVIESVCSMVTVQARDAGVDLAYATADNLPAIRADERRIRQILINLVSNAIKFSPTGSVRITAEVRDGAVVVEVRDTGIGIAECNIAKILEPFGQIDSSLARKFEGSGLGLPITKRLVELQSGTFELASALNAGTTVRVTFPAEKQPSKQGLHAGQPMTAA